jgi:hypothetical protein
MIAAAGASGALAGLVFVALSINLKDILRLPDASGEAGETILLLAATLLGALLVLVPGGSFAWLSGVALAVWLTSSILPTWTQLQLLRRGNYHRGSFLALRVALHQASTLPFLVAALVLHGHNPAGLGWFAAGLLISMAVALLNAWVLLVEIMR